MTRAIRMAHDRQRGPVDAIRHSSYRVAVARLYESDYRKALEVLYAAGEVEGAVAFAQPVLPALGELVPCDVVTFHERSTHPDRVVLYVGEPLGPMTADVREAHRRLKREDPLGPAHGARTLSDVVTLREFRRTAFYQYVHRPLGIEHMLQLYIDPGRTDARLEFDRSDTDFSERDRQVLELLLPHLRQFLQAAARHAANGPRAYLLTAREREVLDHVAEGQTNDEIAHALQISSQTVRKHLENAFDKLGVHTRTAAVAAAFGSR
jgi:DNA-binding CsgD family transcriptional regulator